VSGFVAFGATVAALVAIGGGGFWLQALVWLLVSALGLLALRPYAVRRFRHPGGDLTAPTTSPLTGHEGVVRETVGDELHPGRVTLRSESWRAVTEGAPLEPDTPVVVTKVHGTTLWVAPRS
jgi:membrane protein implicated in regulation of membrane protease activity